MVTRLERRAGASRTARKHGIIVLVLGLLLGCLYPFTAGAESLQPPAGQKQVGKAPTGNTAKLGREAAVRARGYTLFLTANDAVMTLRKAGAKTP